MPRGNVLHVQLAVENDNAVFVMDGVVVPSNSTKHQHADRRGNYDNYRRPVHVHMTENSGDPETYHPSPVDPSHAALVDSTETVTLSWRNIDVFVELPDKPCCRRSEPHANKKHILKYAYGNVTPGTLLAIMGASGAGKTTLLNVLTSRTQHTSLEISGEVFVNGVVVGNGIRNISAYVRQEDMFIATMTVREHLTFRALLRMEADLSRTRRLQRVDEVILEFGLTKCADAMIGDPGRLKGISGGEMRRLSFASEILTNPPLMFCDEPTSGLDAFMAENVVQTLKMMAQRGKTVLCTIHQPSSEVFELFDRVLIMAEGTVAFMGSSQNALEFYKSTGYPCPVNYNPADFYIKTMAVQPGKEEECKQRINKVVNAFEKSRYCQEIHQGTEAALKSPHKSGVIFEEAFSSTSRYESPWYVQFASLMKRSWNTTVREPLIIRVKLAQCVIVGVCLGLIYLRTDYDQNGVMNINGAIFLVLANISYVHLMGVLNSFPIEVPIFYKEYGIGLYNVGIYYICKSLAELPSILLIPSIFSTICYWMVGLYQSATAFFVFTGIIVLVANVSVSFGYMVSVAAKDVNMAVALAPPLMVPLIMFGGFLLNKDSIPVYFIWLEYLSWFRYANEIVAVNQWKDVEAIDCPSTGQNVTCNSCRFPNGDSVLEYMNYEKSEVVLDICLICVLIGFYRIVAFFILLVKARLSRH